MILTDTLSPRCAPSFTPIDPPPGGVRRRLRGDLERLQEQIGGISLPDRMTTKIGAWVYDFKKALNSHADEKWVRDQYTSLLQERLRDPLYQTQLDETSVLGNDGFTYCLRSLTDYRSSVRPPYCTRSPLNPESKILFDHEPHSVVRAAAAWLREHCPSLCPPLVRKASLLTREERLAAIFSRESEIKRERDLQMTDFQEHLKSERMARRSEVRECVDDLMARTDAHAQVAMGRIENIQTNQERLKVALGREITQLEQESVTLGQEVDTLEQQNQRQDRQLSQAKRDTLAVGQQIQEARREIQEERAAGMKALLVTVSLVVACWGSTVFLQNVLLSVGSTAKAAVVPTAGKGTLALLSVSI